MKITKVNRNEVEVAIVESKDIILKDLQSALDLMATVSYEMNCNRFLINKEAVVEGFFKLSTGIAGEILQKFINYQVKFAIYGDFSLYTSEALKAFIYESNKGNNIYFVSTKEDGINKLSNAK